MRTTTLVCQQCGRFFQIPARFVEGRKYCSRECRTVGVAETNRASGAFRGEGNPNWKGGISADKVRYKDRFRARYPAKARHTMP
jgi:hypothetical protein